MIYIDFATVFVSAIVASIIGMVWHSKYFFGYLWEKISNLSDQGIKKKWISYILIFVINIIIAFALALIENYLDVSSFWDGVIAGAILWLGFVVTTQIKDVFFGVKSVKILLLDIVYWLVMFVVMGGIIAG